MSQNTMSSLGQNTMSSIGIATSNSQYIRQQQSCSSAFNCGAEYKALEARFNEISNRVVELENENKQKAGYYKQAKSLIQLQRFILVLLPVIELLIIGCVVYYFNQKNVFAYSLIGLVGLTTLINGFFLPKQIKEIEKRVDKLE